MEFTVWQAILTTPALTIIIGLVRWAFGPIFSWWWVAAPYAFMIIVCLILLGWIVMFADTLPE